MRISIIDCAEGIARAKHLVNVLLYRSNCYASIRISPGEKLFVSEPCLRAAELKCYVT
jgi:hypothetical protein